MERFHTIDDGAVILRTPGGQYRQAKVYSRGKDVFAGYGGGFIKLGNKPGTSNPKVSWLDIEADGVTCDRVVGQPRFGAALAVVG